MEEFADPQSIIDKIDWEGWPDALEWLVGDNFEDEELSQLIADAAHLYEQLRAFHDRIVDRAEELIDNG